MTLNTQVLQARPSGHLVPIEPPRQTARAASLSIGSPVPGAEMAAGRIRRSALNVIKERMWAMFEDSLFHAPDYVQRAEWVLPEAGLWLSFTAFRPDDLYIAIQQHHTRVFSGRLNPLDRSRDLVVQKWTRGWEAWLYAPGWMQPKLPTPTRPAPSERERRLTKDQIRHAVGPEVAVGKSRQLAACAISDRLRKLMKSVLFRDGEPGPIASVGLGAVLVWFARMPEEGTYFRIERMVDEETLMTGYVDPTVPGQYVDGSLAVMSWRARGWEAALFLGA